MLHNKNNENQKCINYLGSKTNKIFDTALGRIINKLFKKNVQSLFVLILIFYFIGKS